MMTDDSTTFFNGVNYCCCKSCIIAEAKKLENKNLFSDAFQLLNDAELYYSEVTKELENEKKALYSRLNENERIHVTTLQSSRTVCQNKNGSMNIRRHLPLNVICGRQEFPHGLPERNPKGEFFCPVAVFENTSDPRQKPMYPKHLVYKDGKDVQLEEIRAAIYWERLKKQATQSSNHLPQQSVLLNQGNKAPSSESENSGIERIRTPPNEEIKKPLQDTCSKKLADFPQRPETSKTQDAINQRKPEVVTVIANTCRSPLHKYNDSNVDKLNTVAKEIKNPPHQAKINENRVIPRLQSRTAVPNTTNLTKPKGNASQNSLHHKIQSFREVSTNKKQLTQTNLPAADKTFIKEQKSSVRETVEENACTKLESNKRNAAVTTDAKLSNVTFICNPVQKTTSILQETYIVQNEQKLPVLNSESLSNEIPEVPKRSNYLNDISKLFEESCTVNSAAKEQRTSKALPVDSEDKENLLPIHMIPSPRDEGEEDNTCTTKAFAVMLPSSTPKKRRSQFFSNGLSAEPKCSINPRPSIASTTVNLSMIPETSRERSSTSSSAGSVASVANLKNLIHDKPNLKNLIRDKPTLSATSETEEKSDSLRLNYDISDPFNPELLNKLLERLQFPREHHQNGYHFSKTDIPAIKLSNSYKLGSKKYTIPAEIGKGSYARILKAHPTNQPREPVALKIQKPACVWEYYISKEILNRLKSEEKLQYFLHYSEIFVFGNCSILLSEWAPYGSLLDFRNAWKAINCGSQEKYSMAVSVYLSIQIISAVHYLHCCRIIHGDIKPDNFIISSVSSDGRPSIKLIDFGRSIDMTLFPENTVFHIIIKTEDFTCNEMRDGKPWTYQTDLFGVAGTFYVLLMGEYMKTIKKSNGLWVLKKPIARYMCRDQWDPIFMTLLNVPSCNKLPDLAVLKTQLEKFYDSFSAFEKKQQFSKMLPIFKSLKL